MSIVSIDTEPVCLPAYLSVQQEFGVIVCTEHRTAYTLRNIDEHLLRAHGLRHPTRRNILELLRSRQISHKIRQPDDYSHPVPGIPVHRGWQCNVGDCVHRSRNLGIIEKHCSQVHQLNTKLKRKERGALSEVLLQHWFAKEAQFWVITPRQTSTVPSSSPLTLPLSSARVIGETSSSTRLENSILLQLSQQVAQEQHTARRYVQQPEHTAEISPWHRLCQYHTHLADIDTALIGSSYMVPQSLAQHSVLYHLHSSVQRVLQSAYSTRASLHHVDSRRLNSFEEGRLNTQGLETLQETQTLHRYILKFSQLTCYFYRVTHEDHFKHLLFQPTTAQSTSLQATLKIIQEVNDYLDTANIDVNSDLSETDLCLQQLYTQLDISTLTFLRELVEHTTESGGFESVVLSFCAAASWDVKSAAWMDETRCGSLLSALVYCCQLVILADSHYRVSEQEFPTVSSAVKHLSAMWLVNTSRGPMCDLLRLRLYAMRVAQNIVHPGQFRWHSDNSTLVFRDITYRMHDLEMEIEYYLTQARLVFRDDLCLGVSDIPTFTLSDFHDNWETRRPGESFLTDIRNASLVEPYQHWWITQVSASSSIYAQVIRTIHEGDAIDERVRSEFAREFEQSVQSFLGFLAMLMHKGSGQPGRSKEFLSIRLKNKDLAPRNLFLHDGYFLFLLTYHKALHRTHASRYPVRFLLPDVGQLLMQFIVLIQPVRRMFCAAVSLPPQVSEYLWHNGSQIWTESHMLKLAQTTSTCAIGMSISMQAWRQMAVAIATKKFSGIQYQGDIDLPAADTSDEPGDFSIQESLGGAMPDVFHLQAAHSAFTGRRIYGGSVNYQAGLTDAALQEYFRASRLWHNLCQPVQSMTTGAHRRKASARLSVSLDPPLLKRLNLKQRPARQIPRWSQTEIQFALKTIFPDKSRPVFRSPQQSALVHAIVEGQPEVVGVLATGEGKSLAFLLPSTLPRAAMTVVILPLVALKSDMRRRCEEADISYAVWEANSSFSDYLGVPLLFVSVEQAVRSHFRAFLGQLDARRGIDRIVFDEAHLVLTASTYRPRLALVRQLRALFCQVVFLTATLPPCMQAQFEQQMLLSNACFVRSQTIRSDIGYHVWPSPRRNLETALVEGVQRVLHSQQDDTSARNIVYTQTRPEADSLAAKLGCPVYYSDSGDMNEKQKAFNQWRNGESKVIVATSAFGMGIDFPCVRAVFHYGPPREMISFVQESGRLSRDGQGGDSHILLPHNWHAPALPTTTDQQRGYASQLAMLVYLNKPRCYVAVLSRFLDGPDHMKYCTASAKEDRCGQCQSLGLFIPETERDNTTWWDLQSGQGAEYDADPDLASDLDDQLTESAFDLTTDISPDDNLVAILPTQPASITFTGGHDRLRSQLATEAVHRERYIRRLQSMHGRCMICTILGEGMISAAQQWHSFRDCRHIQRKDYLAAKRQVLDRQRQKGGWLKKYTACFQCGQPQELCPVGEDEQTGIVRSTPYQGANCPHRDLALPAAWALFHCSTRFGRTLGEISQAPSTVWDTEEHWMDWIGTECSLYGMRACQAVRLLDWFMQMEIPDGNSC